MEAVTSGVLQMWYVVSSHKHTVLEYL